MLAALVVSFLAFVLQMFPLPSGLGQLSQDVRAGRASVVRYDSDGQDTWVRWSAGPLTERSLTYAGDPAAFESQLRRQAGTVRFEAEDAAYGMGGLGLLILPAYPLALRSPLLRILVCAIGLTVVLRCLTAAGHRVSSGPAWLLICTLTGFGFFAYLWAEPEPLLHHRTPTPGGHLRALAVTAVAAAVLVAGGWLLRSVASWAAG
ncbi:hypothetical protein [Streptomyces sp. NBC_01262]|uniref:hypothetical protein n=1 Tax=Streptomyces sp. NBC_01262 TaxID=2903803 RepID=UPI002E32E38B|nr:hypothetical protein [Streptomyces sp. NBC_01262]